MHWNNRIFRHEKKYKDIIMVTYALHETYYNSRGKPDSWAIDPMCGHFDSVDDLIKGLEMMLRDAKRSRKDVLDYEPKKRKKTK